MHLLRLINALSATRTSAMIGGHLTTSANGLGEARQTVSASDEMRIDAATDIASQRAAFLNTFPRFLDMAVKCNYEHGDYPKIAIEHFRTLLSYVAPGGSLHSGLMTVGAATLVRNDTSSSSSDLYTEEEHRHLSNVLGWCSQMHTMCILITDDIIDNASNRHGMKPWFQKNGIGLTAVHDAFLLLHTMHNVLRANFGDKPVYLDLLDTFNETGLHVHVGQSLDTYIDRVPMMAALERSAYEKILVYKTTSIMKGALGRGIRMNGITDPEIYEQLGQVCSHLGRWKQIVNDRKDCFRHYSRSQSTGTDIAEGRSTWLVAKALELANKEQTAIIEENYGKAEAGCAERVKNVYVTLEIDAHCGRELETIVQQVQTLARQPTWKLHTLTQYALATMS